jgi:hypothetical protein
MGRRSVLHRVLRRPLETMFCGTPYVLLVFILLVMAMEPSGAGASGAGASGSGSGAGSSGAGASGSGAGSSGAGASGSGAGPSGAGASGSGAGPSRPALSAAEAFAQQQAAFAQQQAAIARLRAQCPDFSEETAIFHLAHHGGNVERAIRAYVSARLDPLVCLQPHGSSQPTGARAPSGLAAWTRPTRAQSVTMRCGAGVERGPRGREIGRPSLDANPSPSPSSAPLFPPPAHE